MLPAPIHVATQLFSARGDFKTKSAESGNNLDFVRFSTIESIYIIDSGTFRSESASRSISEQSSVHGNLDRASDPIQHFSLYIYVCKCITVCRLVSVCLGAHACRNHTAPQSTGECGNAAGECGNDPALEPNSLPSNWVPCKVCL